MDTRSPYARAFPGLVVAAILLADRLSKLYIQHRFTAFDSFSVIPGLFRIVHSENPGAAFGMLAEGNPILRAIVLIGVSSAVLIFVANALWGRKSTLVLGGAIGNLSDRVLRGTVTDFLEVYNGNWSFPAFNVADSAITVGAAFLLMDLLRPRAKPVPSHASETH